MKDKERNNDDNNKTEASSGSTMGLSNDKHLWLALGEKQIFVMGIFHYDYSSLLDVQNTLETFKPDGVFVELCPFRGKKMLSHLENYEKAYYFTPRDVETAAICYADRNNCHLIFGDVPEESLRHRIKQIDPNYEKQMIEYMFTEPTNIR